MFERRDDDVRADCRREKWVFVFCKNWAENNVRSRGVKEGHLQWILWPNDKALE